jgi:hypothetical protein
MAIARTLTPLPRGAKLDLSPDARFTGTVEAYRIHVPLPHQIRDVCHTILPDSEATR